MQITLTLDLTADNLEKLKIFCEGTTATVSAAPSVPKTTKKTARAAKKAAPEPAETPGDLVPQAEDVPQATEEESEVPFEEEKKQITKQDVRAVALKISKAGKADELKKVFAKFDATKLSEVPEENYEELMAELTKINA